MSWTVRIRHRPPQGDKRRSDPTGHRTRSARRGRDLVHVPSTHKPVKLSQQITDRYTRAIEQLASADTGARIGCIYALERIALDSTRDQLTVVEVLRSTPTPTNRRRGDRVPLTTDVQAALTVLGRLPQRPSVSRGDLSGSHLSDARLGGANLSDARLGGANLSNASRRSLADSPGG